MALSLQGIKHAEVAAGGGGGRDGGILASPSLMLPSPHFHSSIPRNFPFLGEFLLITYVITQASQQVTSVSKGLPNWQPKWQSHPEC